MIQNQFVSSESTFIDLSTWDSCVQPALTLVMNDKRIAVWAGVDASVKRDSTALVACTYDKKTKCVRLINHKIFTPTPGDPMMRSFWPWPSPPTTSTRGRKLAIA